VFAAFRADEMAVEFPHVDFLSLDTVPMVAHTPRANVIYEVYNILNGIEEPDSSFDFVHARHTVTAVCPFHKSLSPLIIYIRIYNLVLTRIPSHVYLT